ncbi:hypothetical protein C0V72_02435 [Porphyrobacter sp. TH134]|uniref:hypothetical protein n=1 Tax=Porphyrobacter sp. TH134 TaxID=2067450 RepID=UPI000C7DF287|nr:hypothetical protein [Porphyrobacter sp. TH134]PLK25169.1 hypothetical protein C0V72_02435 [Porphyrobacter sp. TH134]
MRSIAALAMLGLIAAPAAAEETAQASRIWRGMLGDTAITACFFDEDARAGIYYIDAALAPIGLDPAGDAGPNVSRERGGSDEGGEAIWIFAPDADDRIQGEWQRGDQTLGFGLTAVPVPLAEYSSPCETEAFLGPLLAGGEITDKPARFEGTAYTERSYTGPKRAGVDDYNVATLALDPVRPGDGAINRALAAALPDGTAAHGAGQCAGWSMANGGTGLGYLEQAIVPILISPRWLSVRDSGSSYCGGAHPNHFTGFAVYDRDSGAEVDPAAWFTPGALAFYDWESEPGHPRAIAGLSDALGQALLAHWSGSNDLSECGTPDAIGGYSWQIGLTREGPVFVPQLPHVIFACTEEVVIPWKAARPFLSAEGRAVMDSLR